MQSDMNSNMAASNNDIKKMRMKSKIYGDTLVVNLGDMQKNDELCDFTVSAEGKDIKVHKILLAGTSDYFRAMLLGPMKESQEGSVDLKGLTAFALEQIIDFIYSGQMDLDFDNLIEILNAASHLQIKTALALCSEYMIALHTFANAEELLHIADTYSLIQFSEFHTSKVLKSFEEFTKTEQFLKLPASQLSKYISDDNLQISSEMKLFEMVGKWYAHDQTRLDSLDSVVQHIRFALMSDSQLTQLQQHWLTGQFLHAMNYITEGLKFHSASNVGHPWVNSRSKIRTTEQCLALVHQGSTYRPFEITVFDPQQQKFFQLAHDISGSRDCRIATIENFIFICRIVDCGGGTLMNSLLRFDPRHLKMQELTPSRRLRLDPALVAHGQCLYIFGGTNEHFVILDSVECYDVRTNMWVDLRPMPVATHSLGVTVHKDLVYLSGGVTGPDRQPTGSLFCYNPVSQEYQSKCEMNIARRMHDMVTTENKLYALGGISSSQITQIPIEAYDIRTDQWTVLTSTLAGRSIGHFSSFQGNIISIGREHYEAQEDEFWKYDISLDLCERFLKTPRRMGLSTSCCTLLYINVNDDKISKRIVTEKR